MSYKNMIKREIKKIVPTYTITEVHSNKANEDEVAVTK